MGFPLDLKEVEPQLLNLAFKLLGKLAKSPDTTRSDKKYEMLAMMSAIVLLGDGSFWLGDLNLEINPIRQSRFPRLQAVGVFGSRKLWGFVLQIPRFRNHRKRTKHQEVGLILDQPGSMKQAAWPFCKTSGHRRPKVELKQNDVFPFSHVFFFAMERLFWWKFSLPSASIARIWGAKSVPGDTWCSTVAVVVSSSRGRDRDLYFWIYYDDYAITTYTYRCCIMYCINY